MHIAYPVFRLISLDVVYIYGHLHNGGYARRLSILNLADRRAYSARY